jgi:ATP-dependent Clp protease ATP-binding subunit ClpA
LTLKSARSGLKQGEPGERTRAIPFSAPLRRALEQSLRVALRLESIYIGTEHLLLAVFETDAIKVGEILLQAGADIASVRRELAELMGRPELSSELVEKAVARVSRAFSTSGEEP